MRQLIETMEMLKDLCITFERLTEKIDTGSAQGKLISGYSQVLPSSSAA